MLFKELEMSRISLLDDILDRRIENGALITVEGYARRASADNRLSPEGEKLAEIADSLDMTRHELINMRKWFRKITNECNKRLQEEKTALFTLNESRDRVIGFQLVTKAEAASSTVIVPGTLLDLDTLFGGLLVQGVHIYISEEVFDQGLQKYGSGVLKGLIDERLAN